MDSCRKEPPKKGGRESKRARAGIRGFKGDRALPPENPADVTRAGSDGRHARDAHPFPALPYLPLEVVFAILGTAAIDAPSTMSPASFVCKEWREIVGGIVASRSRHRESGSRQARSSERNKGKRPRLVTYWFALLGHMDLLRWAEGMGCPINNDVVDGAVECGSIEMLEWALSNGASPGESTEPCLLAASRGDLRALKWLAAKGFPWDTRACHRAARGDHLDVLEWADSNGYPFGSKFCYKAAARGHISILKWAKGKAFYLGPRTCVEAARGGHLHVVQWARLEAGVAWIARVTENAARWGHLELLKWAIANGCPWKRNAIVSAAAGGHLDVMEWLADEMGAEVISGKCAVEAARHGNIGVLRWLGDRGFQWPSSICTEAASRGQLTTLMWLREKGWPWGASVCYRAVYRDHVDTAKWARENGCPWDSITVDAALATRNDDFLLWALDRGCPRSEPRFTNHVLEREDHALLGRLIDKGMIQMDSRLASQAARFRDSGTLEWLVERGCPSEGV